MRRMKGLSSKEIEVVSYLELENKRFFIREDIKRFFRNDNELNVYVHKLKTKGRIIKINQSKYYLIPIQAYKGHWSEHPFILVDEIFNGKNYWIGGKAAAHYWGYIGQIPTEIWVYSTSRQGIRKIFDIKIRFIRTTKQNMRDFVIRKVKDHKFIIANKKRSSQWK